MTDNPTTGEELRDAGLALVDSNTPESWAKKCDDAIARLAATGADFTADDVRAICGAPPNHPNAMGARFGAAAHDGVIKRVGYAPSKRPTLHAHPIAVWRRA